MKILMLTQSYFPYDIRVRQEAFLLQNMGQSVSVIALKEKNQKKFEIGVHGLNHDGKLYFSKNKFYKRAILINKYIKKWKVEGFRSPSMHHNLEWISCLDINYDASTFDTDPFEPQPDGVGTIFPFL